MGFAISKPQYTIQVKTGALRFSGTDNDVSCILFDAEGASSGKLKLDKTLKNDFERGSTENYKFKNLPVLNKIYKLHLRREGFIDDEWYVDAVIVDDHARGTKHAFPVHRWIPLGSDLAVEEFDSVLPQRSSSAQDRKDELEGKRKRYEIIAKAPGLFPQIVNFPSDERFSDEYKWDIQTNKYKLVIASRLKDIGSGRWRHTEDIKHLFGSKSFPLPKSLQVNWRSDEWFSEQILSGCNPAMIELCEEIPSNFAVTEDMISSFLEDQSLDDCLKKKRIFIINHKILTDLPKTDPNTVLCDPLALFYLDKKDNLRPIAIQLFQKAGEENPVFLPTDGENLWTLAKMWFNNADAQVHESVSHLGFTHLIMEPVCICTHRHLSPSHPVFRLLAPHFLYLIAINSLALDRLVSPGGWIDKDMSCGRIGMFDLVRRRRETWKMDMHGVLPNELKSRGVDSPEVLPHYPYRDDGLLLYNAIATYARDAVSAIYKTQEDLIDDHEIQNWVKELTAPDDQGGVGLKGVPGDGSFTDVEQLITVVSCIISTCSLGHASVNFNQYDQFSFTPNYPSIMRGSPPTTKDEVTDKDILETLPDKRTTFDVMVVTKVLSDRGTMPLGYFEVQYAYDPQALEALGRFRENLKEIEKKMKQNNEGRKFEYNILYPSSVPNAISI